MRDDPQVGRYDDDFYAWTQEQARLLRAGEFSAVDVANLAEEIESIGRSDRRELKLSASCADHVVAEMAPSAGRPVAKLVGNNR
jgi:hypothetical protein